MLSRSFDALPERMQTKAVRVYYDILAERRGALAAKRIFDIAGSLLLILLLCPLFLILAAAIKLDSKGPVFYRQRRVTKNMRPFYILKFRSMVRDADREGPLVTVENDRRVTKVGAVIRRFRADEMPQVWNILLGQMTFVGTRPEVEKYVAGYGDEMQATLLLPAGLTSRASVCFKDEERLLKKAADADRVYLEEILPQKMVYNLEYLRDFSFREDLKILFDTIFAVSK